MKSLFSQMRRLVGDRRERARRRFTLLASVSVIDRGPIAEKERRSLPLNALTRDFSQTHVAVVVPSVRIGSRYLTAPDSRLAVVMEIPGGTIELQGVTSRYERLEGETKGYSVIMEITRASAGDREAYAEFLRSPM